MDGNLIAHCSRAPRCPQLLDDHLAWWSQRWLGKPVGGTSMVWWRMEPTPLKVLALSSDFKILYSWRTPHFWRTPYFSSLWSSKWNAISINPISRLPPYACKTHLGQEELAKREQYTYLFIKPSTTPIPCIDNGQYNARRRQIVDGFSCSLHSS